MSRIYAVGKQAEAIDTPEIRAFVFALLRNMVETAQEHRASTLQPHHTVEAL